jgi:hypothetical protein
MSLFLWPTPAVTLLGAGILPMISNIGINPLGLAVGLCIFGEGIGLSGDFIIQGAPGLLAKSAGIELMVVIQKSIPLVLGSGLLAALMGFWQLTRLNKKPYDNPAVNSDQTVGKVQPLSEYKEKMLKKQKKNVFGISNHLDLPICCNRTVAERLERRQLQQQ